MTSPVNYQNQQIPGYSGITINITNPAINANPHNQAGCVHTCPQCNSNGQNYQYNQQQYTYNNPAQYNMSTPINTEYTQSVQTQAQPLNQVPAEIQQVQPVQTQTLNQIPTAQPAQTYQAPSPIEAQQAYPAQYYMNSYNIQNNEPVEKSQKKATQTPQNVAQEKTDNVPANVVETEAQETDLSTSKEIIAELDARVAQQKELEKNGKKTRIVALTNEYIMSLENYLNNPNSEIRLMAAKDILTRLNEDKERYDDAALNALLNKMLQDPNKLVRIAALSAFASQLASGNDFTVKLLNDIQNNPNADKEDVLQAANILLMMSASTEIKYVPVKENTKKSENKDLEAAQKQNEQLRSQLAKYKEKEIEQILQSQQGK